jgi:hypothetical protein
MNSTNFPMRTIGWLAIAIGGVTLLGIVSLILFFTVGGPFGAFNDLCNAVEAMLSAALAWSLYPWLRSHAPRLSGFTLIAASLGALIAATGSALIIFDFTGWYLAGLYTMFGYALVGVWLFSLSYAVLRSSWWPRCLAQLGLLTAVSMAIGFLAGPGILGGVDETDAAPWFVNLGLLGSLGWMFLYPFWCLWLGRLVVSNSATIGIATQG